jgi:hypothetical protein
MKDLIIENGKARYLDCSMNGSYYLDCDIIDQNDHGCLIRYTDTMNVEVDKFVLNDEIEII